MKKEIYLAGGCFWGVEKYLANINGVIETQVGYANGNKENPSYEEVCTSKTDFAEAVKLIYDDDILSLDKLLDLFYEIINPTSHNKQGNDIGNQYRTGIYYTDEKDHEIIKNSLIKLQDEYAKEIVVENLPLINYYKAEEYHQKYLDKNPNGYCHINPSMFDEVKEKTKDLSGYKPKSKEELKEELSEIQYHITQENGTEKPFDNEYNDNFEKGIYVDIVSKEPLFLSTDKFEAGCGWPSFSKPIGNSLLEYKEDLSGGRNRTEVRSKLADSHLGHVFEDAPTELGGLRYCINSASLKFIPYEDMEEEGYKEYMYLLEDN